MWFWSQSKDSSARILIPTCFFSFCFYTRVGHRYTQEHIYKERPPPWSVHSSTGMPSRWSRTERMEVGSCSSGQWVVAHWSNWILLSAWKKSQLQWQFFFFFLVFRPNELWQRAENITQEKQWLWYSCQCVRGNKHSK